MPTNANYPAAPKPSPLTKENYEQVTIYKQFSEYLKTNYVVHVPRRPAGSFTYDRVIDKYNTVFKAVNPDIVPRLRPKRLPEELTMAPAQCIKRPKIKKKKVIALSDLPDEEPKEKKKKTEDEEPEEKKRKGDEDSGADAEVDEEAATHDGIDEEEVDDADEELDLGTDYMASYFDGGENFLDDDEGDEDGPVY